MYIDLIEMVRKSKVAVVALRNTALARIAFYGIKKGFDHIYTVDGQTTKAAHPRNEQRKSRER
jgi:hypothetical protein